MVSPAPVRALIAVIATVWLASGCSQPPAVPSADGDETMAAAIRLRATNQFAKVALFKPNVPDPQPLEAQLAPLLLPVQTQSGRTITLASPPIGESSIPTETTNPAVYWSADTVMIHGKAHARFAYTWYHVENELAQARAQGVRLTLDANGFPAIWEVLTDASGMRLVYVGRSVEEKAAVEFGGALAGCRFAVESASPGTLVVRILEDGPVPMGPLVYLEAPSGDVASIVCRCMPAQATAVISTGHYSLVPSSTSGGVASGIKWPEQEEGQGIDQRLRLPRGF